MDSVQEQFEEFRNSKKKVAFEKLEDFFAQLPEVINDEMLGPWSGGYITSGSFIDWTLKDYGFYGWIGKTFFSYDKVSALKHQLFGLKFNIPIIGSARLREINFRGKVSSAVIYNYLPFIDHFRRVDEDTLMGVMEVKGKTIIYFYIYR